MAVFDTMQYLKCDVQTICVGLAASMGSMFLVGGTKGKRYALPHSKIMIHQPLSGARGQISDMEIAVNEGIKLKKLLTQIVADRTGQSYETVAKDMDRDNWMTSEEALEYGIIDKIIKR